MLFVAGENLLPILVALLIGFITGLWIWKWARAARDTRGEAPRVLSEERELRRPYVEKRPDRAPSPAARPVPLHPGGPRPEPEVLARRSASAAPAAPPVAPGAAPSELGDDGLASGAAAAVEDVADQFLGIDAHPAPTAQAGEVPAGDDLQVMKGVGPKLAALLRTEGITRYGQIAALDADDLARLDQHLGAFRGRLQRDRIVEQAAFLARGDREGYERAFGRL